MEELSAHVRDLNRHLRTVWSEFARRGLRVRFSSSPQCRTRGFGSPEVRKAALPQPGLTANGSEGTDRSVRLSARNGVPMAALAAGMPSADWWTPASTGRGAVRRTVRIGQLGDSDEARSSAMTPEPTGAQVQKEHDHDFSNGIRRAAGAFAVWMAS